MGQQWVKEAFSKIHLGPLGKLKHVFLAPFAPGCNAFWPRKIPTCFENAPFLDQKWGQKWVKEAFCNIHLGTVGVLKQVFYPNLSPWLHISPTENPIILKVGHPWTPKG